MSIFKNSENCDLAKFNDTCTSCNLDFKSFEEIAMKKKDILNKHLLDYFNEDIIDKIFNYHMIYELDYNKKYFSINYINHETQSTFTVPFYLCRLCFNKRMYFKDKFKMNNNDNIISLFADTIDEDIEKIDESFSNVYNTTTNYDITVNTRSFRY